MDDDNIDDPTQSFEFRSSPAAPRDVDPDLDDDLWSELGARRGPRQPAEGVRIIGADEAAAAIESGHVTPKKPDDAPRFGDVPAQPAGPRPSLRFPGADPSAVEKPPVAGETLPPSDDRESAAAEAARHWDEVLARSGESRRASRPPSTIFEDDDDDDVFGSGPPVARSRPPERSSLETTGIGSGWFDEAEQRAEAAARLEPASGTGALPQHWTEPPSGEVPRILVEDEAAAESDDDLKAWSTLAARPRWRDQPTDWESGDFDEEMLADPEHRVGELGGMQGDVAPFSFDDEPEAEPELPVGPDRSGMGPGPSGRTRISSLPTARPTPGPSGPLSGVSGPSGPSGLGGRGGDERSDLSSRVITGVIAGGVVLAAAAIGPSALAFLVAVALTMAAAEFYQGLRTRGYQPATLLGLVGTASLVGAVYWQGLDAYPLVLALFVVFTLLWYLVGVVRARPALNVAVTLMVFLYVSFLGSFAALLLTAPDDLGIGLLLGPILATVAHDIGSYFVGRWAGKTPLAPAISPHKTVEGLVGGSLATLFACLLFVRFIDPWDGGSAFWLAVVVAVAAPLGDLCESMIKRDLGLKDMGALLPGHGGVLDRIDALLFVMPATYYLVRLLNF
ncbi:MAG: phosphatidate cytidylyltransferase [Actinobacteria bacterium]|nr:phosphatidate cytidylyltransferase [Actinomycetota bacterium]